MSDRDGHRMMNPRCIPAGHKFTCSDCGSEIDGDLARIGREYVYVVSGDEAKPLEAEVICECCQEDWEEKWT